MNKNNSELRIKPILRHSLSIQNLYQYQDFLKRKHKQTLSFNFQCSEKSSNLIFADGESQNRLFKVIKHLKVIKKADLSQANIRHYHYANRNKTLSIYKKISQVSIISLKTYSHWYDIYRKNSFENWPKLFTKARDITYELTLGTFFPKSARIETFEIIKIKNLQRNIRFCPKLQSLVMKFPQGSHFLSNIFHEFERYPQKLKRLVIQPASSFQESKSSLECLKNLEAISLRLSSRFCLQFIKNIMDALSILPNLQEIDLEFKEFQNSDIYPLAFNKIAAKALSLKKLKLKFDQNDWVSQKILKSLQDFHHLTSFTLSLKCNDLLQLISECIKNMTQLQYLKLTLVHSGTSLQPTDDLKAICIEIGKLEQLEHLKLLLNIPALNQDKKTNNLNFLLSLNDVFTKPKKQKTFHVECVQANPFNMYLAFFRMLENSKASLQKLIIDLGNYYPEKDHQKTIISSLKGILNLRTLELPHLGISDKQFLNEIAEAVQNMKNLEVLRVHLIKSTVTKSGFFQALESILKKRGLKRFDYKTGYDFLSSFRSTDAEAIDLKEVLRRNPCFEIGRMWIFKDPDFNKDW